jgi:DNA-binding IclR family transcriptional regulator
MVNLVQRGVASVEVAGSILQTLRGSTKPMSLRELAGRCGLAPSRLHHYLVSLVRVGLVRRDARNNQYALGSFALELGLVAADSMDLQHASAAWLHRLSTETEESTFFAVPSSRGALIVRWEQGSRPLTVHARLGTVMPILTSATGLAWLAYDPDGSASVLQAELRKIDPTLRDQVRHDRLAAANMTLRQGMAVALGSMIGNVNALACPVLSRSSGFVGVLTVLGLGGFFDAALDGRTAKRLRTCAAAFGQRLP